MMHNKNRLGFGFKGVLASCALLTAFGASSVLMAQEPATSNTTSSKKRVYNTGRDPFKKYEPPRAGVKKIGGVVIPPNIQERIEQYRAQKTAAMNARMPAPKPTTALLLNEIQVVGISRTPRGYAAIIEATPIKLSYVIYPGEPFYDGQLVAIEDNRLVFRRETVYSDGRRERSVELKPLRQPNTVNAMAAVKPATPAEPEAPKQQDEKSVATAKP
ncbi:MAG: hypothetical protein C5B55_01765 [Blastocatellia bacterium]|nr:MAG: hypothetical protein C5B55_01765 [Blastocatellia bacterium]